MSFAIYVSQDKPQTIIELKRELSNDGNYITEGLAKSSVRIRFLPFVYCIDCGDVQCSVGGIDLGHNTPKIKCDNCGFIYHDNKGFIDKTKL
jgi:ribosomal protein S27E